MAGSELEELRRAMEVGFAKLDGRFDVVDERLKALGTTQERHEEELGAARERRWPLPVLGVLGSLGGIASIAAWVTPHK
ncbi:hypothetical protein ABH931_006169 [Streptacidiphilus sp. MAP12-33]|uniref:hypothetical protein n=1 Tax=Streptacidiphilus sp. MAP12-33 TaxID=3156266 RepID=UPI003513D2D9